MKLLLKALLWGSGIEILLLALVLIANHARLGPFDFVFGVLSHLALFCHVPAVWLLSHCPTTQQTLIRPALLQWCLWFITLGVVFALRHIFKKRRLEHESHAA